MYFFEVYLKNVKNLEYLNYIKLELCLIKDKVATLITSNSATAFRAKQQINEMAHYIDQEFTKWQLTNAENAVAWLIIKGFSFKEIAQLRQVSEKTISQQSATIYKKSGYNNRHELMSAFLEEFVNFSV